MYSFQLKADTVTELHKKIINFAKELEASPTGEPVSFEKMQEDGEDSYNQMPTHYSDADPVHVGVDPAIPGADKTVITTISNGSVLDTSELDAAGMPFDDRIHTSARTKVKSGTWKYKKGVNDETINAIEKQTREKLGLVKQDRMVVTNHAQPAPQIQVSAPIPTVPPASVHVAAPVFQSPAPAVQVSTPVYADPVVPIAAPVQQATRPAFDFASFKTNFVTFVSSLISQKKIDRPYILELCNYFQIPDIWEITKDDAKTLELFNNFAAYGWLTKVG